jgi:SagB-type dehydrogenase family enzyme
MRRIVSLTLAVLVAAACGGPGAESDPGPSTTAPGAVDVIDLPAAPVTGGMSLAEALAGRRSVREYGAVPPTLEDLGALLWAAQGHTQPEARGRTAPSAGGTYPLELFVVSRDGVFHYLPGTHQLEVLAHDDRRAALGEAALGQEWVSAAPAVVLITAVFARTEVIYGKRAERYVTLEAGHAAQNLLLQAVALGLGAVPVGAFRDAEVREVVGLAPDEQPLYLIPVGALEGG